MPELRIEANVNGRKIARSAEPHQRLLDFLREDLHLTGTKDGCGAGECGACSVFVDGVRGTFTHEIVSLAILPERPIPGGENVSVRVFYEGHPRESGLKGFEWARREDSPSTPVISTLSEPSDARQWWPCKDRPDDKATCRVAVTVPSGWTAVSNGALVDSLGLTSGDIRMTWEEKYPIATYLVSVAATNYAGFHEVHRDSWGQDINLDFFVYPSSLGSYKRKGPVISFGGCLSSSLIHYQISFSSQSSFFFGIKVR